MAIETPKLGVNCDVILSHPDVGEYGFMLERSLIPKSIHYEWEAYTNAAEWVDRTKIVLRLQIGKGVIQPNGQRSPLNTFFSWGFLQDLIYGRTNITLKFLNKEGEVWTFGGLHASLKFLQTDFNLKQGEEGGDVVVLTLNNGGYNEAVPIDFAALNASYYDSGLTFDQGYLQ